MTEAYELRNMVDAEQQEFATMLRGLSPEQWKAPSLCRGWSVHDAVIHIAIHSHTGATERFGGLVRAGLQVCEDQDAAVGVGVEDLLELAALPYVEVVQDGGLLAGGRGPGRQLRAISGSGRSR